MDPLVVDALEQVKGIQAARPVAPDDVEKIEEIERDAEARSLMGLGKVVNSGIREVVRCPALYAALTDMEFDWGDHSSLLLKKGNRVVGQEVRDERRIAALKARTDVWFLHRNFVVYKERIAFPQDIMKKICHFEIPCLPADWCRVEDPRLEGHAIVYANPSPPCDRFLKETYFDGQDERGLGTILVGVRPESP
ncbi:MAG: hypothetical protein Kow0092_34790 [Deferrisomatales bacterium]